MLPRLISLFALCLFLQACSGSGKAPTQSWEVAVKGHYSAALSHDGSKAVIGSITHGGSLWNVPQNKRLFSWNHNTGDDQEPTNIIAATMSPDGKLAFTADHQTMVLWDAESGSYLTFWRAPHEVLSVDLTDRKDTGIYAALALGDHTAVIYNAGAGRIAQTFQHQNRVRSVSLSTDGYYLLSGSEDQTAKFWNVRTGELLTTFQHNDEVRLVALSPSGDTAFSVSKYDRAVLWSTVSGDEIGDVILSATALKRGQTFTAARFSANGKQLLTGSADRVIQLWDVASRKELARWEAPKRSAWKPTAAAINAVAFGPANTYYAIASNGFVHQLKR